MHYLNVLRFQHSSDAHILCFDITMTAVFGTDLCFTMTRHMDESAVMDTRIFRRGWGALT